MNIEMEQKMQKALLRAKQLPRCPFVLSNENPNEPVGIGIGRADNPTYEEAFVGIQLVGFKAWKVVRRMMEEVSAVFFSEAFQNEWGDFVNSILDDGKLTKASRARLRSRRTSEWFKEFCHRWGIIRMSGWQPEVGLSNSIKKMTAVYRCDNCGQRHYSSNPWRDSGCDPLSSRNGQSEHSESIYDLARCCNAPSLKPLKVKIDMEVYADITHREWGEIRRIMSFALTGRWKRSGTSPGKDLRQRIAGHPWPRARKEFLYRLGQEARRLFPKALEAVEIMGKTQIVDRVANFEKFWKGELGLKTPRSTNHHDTTFAYALLGLILKKRFKAEIEEHKYKFSRWKLKRLVGSLEKMRI